LSLTFSQTKTFSVHIDVLTTRDTAEPGITGGFPPAFLKGGQRGGGAFS